MSVKISDYKGYVINYESFYRTFKVDSESFATQLEAEKYIDKLVKVEKSAFEPIPVIRAQWSSIVCGKVTGIIDDKDAWFRSEDGKRSKGSLKYLYQATDDNLEKLRLYRELDKQITDLIQKRDAIKFDDSLKGESKSDESNQ